MSSFCLRAASRASAASRPLLAIALAAFGFSSRNLVRYSPKRRVDDAFDFAVAELGFGLAFELRMGHAATDDGGEAFAEVFAGGDEVFEEAVFLAVVVDAAGEGGAEAGEMRAAFGRVDVVDVRVDVLGVLGRVLQGDFDGDAFALAFDVQDFGVDGLAGAVEVLRRIRGGRRRTGNDSFSPVRSSAMVMRTPWLRKASSCMRFWSVAKTNFVVWKICGSGLKVVLVPRLVVLPTRRTSVLGMPRSYSWW